MKMYRYDYYKIEVPPEIKNDIERGEIAIRVADDNARIWCMPAEWTVLADDGNTVTVRRKRYNIRHIPVE